MKYLIPGKTFLLGEYSALVGGSVIALATGPGFEVSYKAVEPNSVKTDSALENPPFHLDSAAGIKIKKHPSLFQNMQIQLQDGFLKGGFGKSTAEYLSALIPTLNENTLDFSSIRSEYQACSRESGAEVSGLDLAIPFFGQVMVYQSKTQSYSSQAWPFPDHNFILVSTGEKIKTHEHLQKLDSAKIKEFPLVSNPIVDSFLKGHLPDFISGLNEWSEFLFNNQLTLESSRTLAQEIKKKSGVVSVKPCGALGADVVCIICTHDSTAKLKDEMSAMGLKIQSTSADLKPGVLKQLKKFQGDQFRGSYVG